MNIIHKGIAKFFWNACDRIDNMPCRNIDELAKKADEVAKLQKEYDRMPKHIKEAIQNVKRSEVA